LAEVIFEKEALLLVKRESLAAGPAETGGALLGAHFGGGVVVREASGPGPRSRSSEVHFVPDEAHLNAVIRESETRGMGYVGEWHKHPGSMRWPSPGDRTAFAAILQKSPQIPSVVIVITTVNSGSVGPETWMMERDYQARPARGVSTLR